MIFVAMILLGSVIGFVGAGGAGVTITLLTVGFGVPVHTALAVSPGGHDFYHDFRDGQSLPGT